MRTEPPKTAKFEAGGVLDDEEITCDRCDDPATRGYEGKEFLNLCERCYEDLGRWLANG